MPPKEHGQRSLGVLGAGAGHLAIGTQIGGGQGQAKAAGPLGWGEYEGGSSKAARGPQGVVC